MKNKAVLLLLLCSCAVVVQAQDYYLKTINMELCSSDNGVQIIAEDDGYAINGAVGFLGNSIAGVGMLKTDLQGNKVWEAAEHFYPYESGPNNLLKLPNNNYLITGARGEEGLTAQGLYVLISPTGHIIRNFSYGDVLDNRSRYSLSRNNQIVSTTNFGNPHLNAHILLLTMDTACNTIIRQDTLADVSENGIAYDFTNGDEFIVLPNNEYVMVIAAQTEANKVYGYIRKIDTLGTTIWEHRINNYIATSFYSHLSLLKDGNFVVTWYERLAGDSLVSHIMRCYNAAGDSLWQHTFKSDDYIRNIQSLHVCANGDIIGAGYTTNFSYSASNVPTSWLFRLSAQGELLWQREYVNWGAVIHAMLLYGVTEDAHGDIVASGFAGIYNELGGLEVQVALLKVNSMGCFGEGGCNDSTIVVSTVTGINSPIHPLPPPKEGNATPSNGGLMVFPNPANSQIQVLLPNLLERQNATLQLIDLQGRVLKSANLSNSPNNPLVTLSTTELPNGMYVLTYTVLGVVQSRAKVVVNHATN